MTGAHARSRSLAVRKRVLHASIAAAVILIDAAVYAFTTAEIYRSEAMVVLEVSGDASKLVLPSAQDVARRMRDTLLVDSELELLGREASPHAAGAAAKDLARRSIEVQSAGGRTYAVAYAGPDPELVQRVCNLLAGRVSDRSPATLGSTGSIQSPDPLELSMRKLAAFAAMHPEVALEADAHADQDTERAQKATLEALKNRRATILMRLDSLKANQAPPSDNPYAEPGEDEGTLNRQLSAVNAAIANGESAKKAPAKARIDLDVIKEWKQLVVAVADARRQAGDQPHLALPTVTVRIVSAAPLPTTPISSKRTLIMLVGAFVAAIVGVLWVVIGTVVARRRSDRTRTGFRTGIAPDGDSEPPPPEPLRAAFAAPSVEALGKLATVQEPVSRELPPAAMPNDPEPARSEAIAEPMHASDRPVARQSSRPNSSYSYVSARPPPPDDEGRPAAEAEQVERVLRSPPPAMSSAPTILGSPPPAMSSAPTILGSPPPAMSSAPTILGSPPPRSPPPRSPPPPSPRTEAQAAPEVSFVDVGWTAPESLYPVDALKGVRDQVFALGLEQCAVVLVCGSVDARGRKARLAARLALALADTGHPRVLLLEGDLDSPAASATIGVDVPMSAGLSQQLEGLMHNDPSRPIKVLRCTPSLHVLGESVIRSPGIVLSVVFEHAISTFRRYFDVIVIDGPPAVPSLDVRAIDALVDGVVFADPTLKPSSLGLTPPPGPAVRGLFGHKRLLIAVPA